MSVRGLNLPSLSFGLTAFRLLALVVALVFAPWLWRRSGHRLAGRAAAIVLPVVGRLLVLLSVGSVEFPPCADSIIRAAS